VSSKKEGLSRKERLTLNRDFERLFKEGKRLWIGKYLLIIYAPNRQGFRRLGLVVSSKIGKAAARNRVKRLLRELFRKNKELFPEGADLLLIPHPRVKDLSYAELLPILKEYLSRRQAFSFGDEKTST